MWKSHVDNHTSTFSFGEPPRGRDLYSSPKISSGNTKGSTLNYNENNSLPPVSSKPMYWSYQGETVTESFVPAVNKEIGEKRQSNGYRLFGIELIDRSTVEETLPTVVEDQPAASLEAEFDSHSEPSNVNRPDIPSISCEIENSCPRSTQESQSRQIRSCTKVLQIGVSCFC